MCNNTVVCYFSFKNQWICILIFQMGISNALTDPQNIVNNSRAIYGKVTPKPIRMHMCSGARLVHHIGRWAGEDAALAFLL